MKSERKKEGEKKVKEVRRKGWEKGRRKQIEWRRKKKRRKEGSKKERREKNMAGNTAVG